MNRRKFIIFSSLGFALGSSLVTAANTDPEVFTQFFSSSPSSGDPLSQRSWVAVKCWVDGKQYCYPLLWSESAAPTPAALSFIKKCFLRKLREGGVLK